MLDAIMENRHELYRQAGEALHLAQALELNIRVLISLLNSNFGTDLDQDGLILRDDKKTLGRLITELKKHASLDDEGSKALETALEKRNYIAHEFFNRNVSAFSDKEAYKQSLRNLTADTKTIAIATAITQAFMQGFCEALKVDINEILVKQRI